VAAAQVITGTQAVHAASEHTTHVTTAAEDFAAKKAAEDAAKKEANIKTAKNPIVLGSIGAVAVLIVVIIIMASGGDDDNTPSAAAAAPPVEATEAAGIPQEGLVAFIDFDNGSISDKGESNIALEALKSRPMFSNNGLSGKALVLDKKHYYRLPITSSSLADKSKDFTLSFWMRSASKASNNLAVLSKEPWMDGNSEPYENDDALWQWNPRRSEVEGNEWSMITMIYSRSENSISLYLDGRYAGTSSNDELDSNKMHRFIYIGCDSNENFLHQSPMVIDDLAIWDRALPREQIEDMFDKASSYN
jgi:hypothetical protein